VVDVVVVVVVVVGGGGGGGGGCRFTNAKFSAITKLPQFATKKINTCKYRRQKTHCSKCHGKYVYEPPAIILRNSAIICLE
jgi:hypothetical protein